jgi:hypothetical protein
MSPSEVFEELKDDKEIGEWLRQRRSAIEVEPDARLIGEFARLNRTYAELTKKKKVRAKNVADAWVIGYAKINRIPVVSKEALKSGPEKIKRCIPGVCQLEGIEHLHFLDFVRRGGS